MNRVRHGMWVAGAPVRMLLVLLIRVYRVTLSGVLGGRCRFHPSCSEYAEQAVRSRGAILGTALSVWRVLRCSPLSSGGLDYPPGAAMYDTVIRKETGARS